MKYALAFAAALAAGSAHAQTWSHFIQGPGYGPVTLAAPDGVRDDALDGFVVTAYSDNPGGLPFAELHALSGKGEYVAKPVTFEPSRLPPVTLTPRATSAHAGDLVSWFEVADATGVDDVVAVWPHDGRLVSPLRIRRVGGSRVVHAATDGMGGVIVVRKPGGWSFPVVERMYPEARAWQTLWSVQVGATGNACGAGTRDVLASDAVVDLGIGLETGRATVLGYCDGGVTSLPANFMQSIDLIAGSVIATRTFRTSDVNTGTATRHALGDGAWLYASKNSAGQTALRVADVRTGVSTLPWPADSGTVRVDRQADGGALVGAHVASLGNAYSVSRLSRNAGAVFQLHDARTYPSLSGLSHAALQWAQDAQQRRVVAWRTTMPKPTVQLRGFDANGMQTWQRAIDDTVTGAEPQLRFEPSNGSMVLAVNANGTTGAGVHVEGFHAGGDRRIGPVKPR